MEWYKNLSVEDIVAEIEGVLYVEEWRAVKDNPKFMVSSFGRIKRLKTFVKCKNEWKSEIIRSQNKSKYLRISFGHGTKSVHRIVCAAFHPNPENKPQVNHIDTIKWNNFYLNVEWATQSENIVHAQTKGILPFAKQKPSKKKRGKKKGSAGEYKPIIDLSTGIFWNSDEVAMILNTKRRYIHRMLNEDRKPNTSQYRYA